MVTRLICDPLPYMFTQLLQNARYFSPYCNRMIAQLQASMQPCEFECNSKAFQLVEPSALVVWVVTQNVLTTVSYRCFTCSQPAWSPQRDVWTRATWFNVVKNVTWGQHSTNEVFIVGLPMISTAVRERCYRSSGHWWSKNEVVSDLVLREPKHGKRSVRARARTFVDLLEADTAVPRNYSPAATDNWTGWRKRAMGVDWGRSGSSST